MPKITYPEIRDLVEKHPKLRRRFRATRDGFPIFLHSSYDPEKHGWDVTSFDGEEDGIKVIDGRTWRVITNAWITEARVTVDEVPAHGPDCTYEFYDAFELVDLGVWQPPDFATHLQQAENELRWFDVETAARPRKRESLVAEIEKRKRLVR